MTACAACGGAGWLRRDVPTWDPAFAKPVRCGACNPSPVPIAPPAPNRPEPRRPRLRIVS